MLDMFERSAMAGDLRTGEDVAYFLESQEAAERRLANGREATEPAGVDHCTDGGLHGPRPLEGVPGFVSLAKAGEGRRNIRVVGMLGGDRGKLGHDGDLLLDRGLYLRDECSIWDEVSLAS